VLLLLVPAALLLLGEQLARVWALRSWAWDAVWYHHPMTSYAIQDASLRMRDAHDAHHIEGYPNGVELIGVWLDIFPRSDALEDAIRDGLRPTYSDDYEAPRPSDAGEAAMIAAVVAEADHTITEYQVALYSRSTTWTEVRYDSGPEPPLPSVLAAFSAMLGVLVALVGWRLTRTWVLRSVTPAPPRAAPWSRPDARGVVTPKAPERPVGRPTRGAPAPVPVITVAAVRKDATQTLDTLARSLAHSGSGPRLEAAIGCRVAAERVIASSDLLDVVGALVLARTGRSLLRTADPYRPCFVNPLHGEGTVEIEITDGDEASLSVPACRRCGSTRGLAQELDPLLEAWWGLRGSRPYYEGGTLWARTGFGGLDPDLWRLVVSER